MFDKMKQINEMRKLQQQMQEEKYEAEQNGVRATVNGNFQIENVTLNPDLEHTQQEQILKGVLNEALKKAQLGIAQKFQGMI